MLRAFFEIPLGITRHHVALHHVSLHYIAYMYTHICYLPHLMTTSELGWILNKTGSMCKKNHRCRSTKNKLWSWVKGTDTSFSNSWAPQNIHWWIETGLLKSMIHGFWHLFPFGIYIIMLLVKFSRAPVDLSKNMEWYLRFTACMKPCLPREYPLSQLTKPLKIELHRDGWLRTPSWRCVMPRRHPTLKKNQTRGVTGGHWGRGSEE